MVTVRDYVEVICSDEMRAAAEEKLADVEFDVRKGLSKFGSEEERTLVGYIGERVVMACLALGEDQDDVDFDLRFRGKRLEVKTISCKDRPLEHYLCTVNSFDLAGTHKQDADYYVFVRVRYDLSVGWVVGFLSCEAFFASGTFVQKGEALPGVSFMKFEKANGTVLPIRCLLPIAQMLDAEAEF